MELSTALTQGLYNILYSNVLIQCVCESSQVILRVLLPIIFIPSLPSRFSPKLSGRRHADRPSTDATSPRRLGKLIAPRRTRPFAIRASVWTISLLGKNFTVYRHNQVSFRTFFLSALLLSSFQHFPFYLRLLPPTSLHLPHPRRPCARCCALSHESVKFQHPGHRAPRPRRHAGLSRQDRRPPYASPSPQDYLLPFRTSRTFRLTPLRLGKQDAHPCAGA